MHGVLRIYPETSAHADLDDEDLMHILAIVLEFCFVRRIYPETSDDADLGMRIWSNFVRFVLCFYDIPRDLRSRRPR